MPLIQPPPQPPKKVTIAVRMEEADLFFLRGYEAYIGTRNHSHIVVGSLKLLYQQDTEFKAWWEAHPHFATEKKSRHNGSAKRQSKAAASGAAVSSAVAAAQAASLADV